MAERVTFPGVRVWVPGRARTKGSLKPMHIRLGAGRCKVGLREDGEYSVPWKKTMIKAIQAQVGGLCQRWPDAVEVHSFFRFDFVSAGSQEADPWPVGRQYGDEDKLRRNLLDALTQSALLADDSQVVGGPNWKRWTQPGEDAGVWIVVMPARDLRGLLAIERAWTVPPVGSELFWPQNGSQGDD